MRLHHMAVVCRTRENAARFYEGVLGLRQVKEKTLDEDFMLELFGIPVTTDLVMYGGGEVSVEVFIPASGVLMPPRLAHACLEVANQSSFINRCRAAGVPVKQVLRQGAAVVFVQDYDGNLYEIKEASTGS